MALRRTSSLRLLHINRTQLPFTPTSSTTIAPLNFGRFVQSRALVQSAMALDYCSSSSMMEKLKEMKISKDRLRFDGLMSPMKSNYLDGISVDDARKLLRLAQLEMLKSKLKQIKESSISYSEFVQICTEGSSRDQGLEFAKMLDESGAVIVIKDNVFLHPEQVAKAIQGVIPLPIIMQPSDSRVIELDKMEKEKMAIDRKAKALVRKELWCGLGFLVFQTAGFMRLTFWELSWDVMEPICFYVTSLYFMASYAFFLRTSQEPSFEGFFQSRFRAKQKQLMKAKKFDLERFNELRRACYPHSFDQQPASALPTYTSYNNSQGSICAIHN